MMLAIQRKADESTAVKVNLLPVRIQYDGSMEIEKKHWNPECTEDGKHKAYFRGRELEGNVVKVPEGFKGAVVRVTGDVLPTQRPTISQEDDDEDEVEQPVEETRIAQEIGTFDEVMVWNHDVPWDGAEDSYARGISEWMTFANAIHAPEISEPNESTSSQGKS